MSKSNSGWVRRQTAMLLSATLALSPVAAVPVLAAEAGGADGAVTEQPAEKDEVVEKDVESEETTESTEPAEKGAEPTPAAEGAAPASNDVSPQAEGVATVNGATYSTLSEAFDAVPSDGTQTTVTLTGDIVMSTEDIATIDAGQSVILEMSGHKITVDGSFQGRPIVNNGTLVIQGNGTIDSSASVSGGYGAINNYGTLIIKNGTYSGSVYASGSCIRNTGSPSKLVVEDGRFEKATCMIYNEGTAELNGGSYIGRSCSSCDNEHWAYTLQNHDSGDGKLPTLTVNGGTYEGVQGVVSSSYGTLTVNGGTFTAKYCDSGHQPFYALYVAGEDGYSTAVVNNGTFVNEGTRNVVMVANDNTNGDGGINAKASVTLAGGMFTSKSENGVAVHVENLGSILISGGSYQGKIECKNSEQGDFISGGTFSQEVDKKYLAPGFAYDSETGAVAKNEDAVVTVSNADGSLVGAYKSLQDAVNAVPEGGTVALTKDVAGNGVKVAEDKEFTLDLGGFTYTVDGSTVGSTGTETNGFQLLKGSNITIKNGTITSNKALILIQNYSNLTLEDVDLVGGTQTQYVLSNNCGDVHICKDTTITAAEGQVAFDVCRFGNYDSVQVTVDEGAGAIVGRIEVADAGGTGAGAWSLTINGGDLSQAELSIQNADKASIAKSPTVALAAPEGYQWVDGELKKASDPDIETVASITDASGNVTYFSTLSDAVSAATEGQTIALLGNVTESVTIPADKSVTLDLAGHTLTNADGEHTVTVTKGGTLTVTDSSADKAGVIDNVSHGKAALFNDQGGTVVLNGGTFNRSKENGSSDVQSGGNSFYTLQNYGSMTINEGVTVRQGSNEEGGKFSSLIENGWYNGKLNTSKDEATMVINGGSFVGGLNTIKNDDWGVLTINGGSFTNTAQAAVLNWNKTTIKGGEFQSDQYAVLNGKLDDSMDVGELVIEGGSFKGGNGYKVVSQMSSSTSIGSVAISGGEFWTAPDEEFIVPGSGLTQNSDGSFVIHEHIGTAVAAKDPTCTEAGNKAYWECSECHELFLDEAMTQPTTREYVTIAATGHQHVTHVEAKDATKTEAGNLEYWFCADCGRYFLDEALTKEATLADVTIPATGTAEPEEPSDEKPAEGEKGDGLAQTGDPSAVAPLAAAAAAGAGALLGALRLRRRDS